MGRPASWTAYYERDGKSYPTTMDGSGRGIKRACHNLARELSALPQNAGLHVAVMRNGINVAMFLDGKEVAL